MFGSFNLDKLKELRHSKVKDKIDKLPIEVRVTDIQVASSAAFGVAASLDHGLARASIDATTHSFMISPLSGEPPAGSVTWHVEVLGPRSADSNEVSLLVNPVDQTNVAVTVASTVQGDVVLYCSYLSASGKLVFGKPIRVVSNPITVPAAGVSASPATISMVEGKTFFPGLVSSYEGGLTKIEFIGPDTEIDATSSDESVVSVERMGFKLVAKAPGTATVIVHYHGYDTGVNVVVEAAHHGTVQFAVARFEADEATGKAQISVQRTDGSDGKITVHYSSSDGSALAGSNYTFSEGEFAIDDGETSGTITVPMINDTVFLAEKTFNVTLSSPTGGATLRATAKATVAIHNDDIFIPKAATFRGVALPTSSPTSATSGGLSLSVNRGGTFTGDVNFGGVRTRLIGLFDSKGFARMGAPGISWVFDLQMDDGGDVITVTFSNGIHVEKISGERAAFDSRHITPLAGKYMLVFPPDPANKSNAAVPQGSGYGVLTVWV